MNNIFIVISKFIDEIIIGKMMIITKKSVTTEERLDLIMWLSRFAVFYNV
jgi:hypothetical protein